MPWLSSHHGQPDQSQHPTQQDGVLTAGPEGLEQRYDRCFLAVITGSTGIAPEFPQPRSIHQEKARAEIISDFTRVSICKPRDHKSDNRPIIATGADKSHKIQPLLSKTPTQSVCSTHENPTADSPITNTPGMSLNPVTQHIRFLTP